MLVGSATATACEGYGGLRPEHSMLVRNTPEGGLHQGCLRPPLLPSDWKFPSWSAAAARTAANAAMNGPQAAAGHHLSQLEGATGQSRWEPDIWVGGSMLHWVGKFNNLDCHFTSTIQRWILN